MHRSFRYMSNIFRVFTRILNLSFYPANELKDIATENNSRKTIYIEFVVPLLCLMTIAIIIGTWLNTSRELYSAGYVIYRIAMLWTSLSAGLYISSFVVTEIIAHHTGAGGHNRDFALMAYSAGTAYLVIIIVALFPFFNELYVLAFYSCYRYWTGIPHLIRIDGINRTKYGILSLLVMLLTYSLSFFFFDKVFKAIFLNSIS